MTVSRKIRANVDFLGQIPDFFPESADENRSDYRPVPDSDTGETYRDRGMLGSWQNGAEQFGNTAGVRYFTGFACTEADAVRGFSDPLITDGPAYDLDNYKERSTIPRSADGDEADATENDFEFRRRNEKARGFLRRPHIPTER